MFSACLFERQRLWTSRSAHARAGPLLLADWRDQCFNNIYLRSPVPPPAAAAAAE